MPIRQRQFPVRFTPKGLVDALDATDKFQGACVSLTNLIFDQLNPEIVVAKPGESTITSFSSFSSPGVISVQVTVGDVTYGLIASTRNAGNDEPFAYNNATNSFVVVTGITGVNTPVSQSTTGPWTPPTMAVIGTLLVVTHPGFPGGATKFGWFDISNPAAPVWAAGDCATNALPSTPTSVANFNNRAYFACGQTLPFSDVLAATTRTNSSQALTVGDTSSITALSGLPVQTTSGGITQALMVFKAFQIWQVTGDSASSTLALNYLSLTIGSTAPRSIWQSPYGLYFISDGGPYIVDTLGVVRPLTAKTGEAEPDIQAPFQNALNSSRAAACYAGSIFRVCLETIIRGTQSFNDYWFDEHRRRWNGPHTFAYDCASPYSDYMILCSNQSPAKLFKSQLRPDSSSVYTDDSTAITASLLSSTFPKEGGMTEKQVVESTLELSNAGSTTVYTIQAQDEQTTVLNNVMITVLNTGKVWGGFVWGDGTLYASTVNRPRVYNVPWTAPVVFQKMALSVSAPATSALSIGSFYARYQDCGYVNVPNP